MFVTLFADNQPFISAVTMGNYEAPLTYSLELPEDTINAGKCIFIIEDSQLDIGLLVAVERNMNRILQIIADYLVWNEEKIADSIRMQNEPDIEEEKKAFDVYAEDSIKEKKKGLIRRIVDWLKGLFKKKKSKSEGETKDFVSEPEKMEVLEEPAESSTCMEESYLESEAEEKLNE